MRKRFAWIVALSAVFALVAGSAGAVERYRFGGGPSGGAWHPATSAGTQLLNRNLKEVSQKISNDPNITRYI